MSRNKGLEMIDDINSGQRTDSDKQPGRYHTELGYHDGPVLGLLLTCDQRERVNQGYVRRKKALARGL